MHTKIVSFLAVMLVATLGASYYFYPKEVESPIGSPIVTPGGGENTACTMDVMQCSDGSYVGRTGPKCEFKCVSPTAVATSTSTVDQKATVSMLQGVTKTALDISITPIKIVQDSRCPPDVTCIQAGTIKLAVNLTRDTSEKSVELTLNDRISFEGTSITFTKATGPSPVKENSVRDTEYQYTFEVIKDISRITYNNATADNIVVTSPTPQSVMGKGFKIIGKARGSWFFEASFPVNILDSNGKSIVQTYAEAQGNWMTADFVPFSASITIPRSYSGKVTVVLKKDNPSGLQKHDASISYLITIE